MERELSRRAVMKASLSLATTAFWVLEGVFGRDEVMTESKRDKSLPAVVSYEDIHAVSPALEHYTSGSVTFEPGARTAWHTHPLGQTLIVTAGAGWIQREGGPIEDIKPGDIVCFAPGEKHWHGATPTTAMTHIAIQENKDGRAADWMEHVSDEQYRRD